MTADVAEANRPLEDVFVLDSTVHGCNTLEDNFVPDPYRERVAETLSNMLYLEETAFQIARFPNVAVNLITPSPSLSTESGAVS
jgi:hypothetical protein